LEIKELSRMPASPIDTMVPTVMVPDLGLSCTTRVKRLVLRAAVEIFSLGVTGDMGGGTSPVRRPRDPA